MGNIAEQADEVEVLISIYAKDFNIESEVDRSYSIDIDKSLKLYFTFGEDYPSTCPPKYTLIAPYLSGQKKKKIYEEFAQIYRSE